MNCTYDGCEKPRHSRDLCGTHYARWRRTGSPHLQERPVVTCSVEGCDRVNYSNLMCSLHYNRLRRTGTVDEPLAPSLGARFWAMVEKTEDCWHWKGAISDPGYGRISVGNRLRYAHRLSYELNVGPIPDGLSIDHLCRVRDCVRPDHLEAVTLAENTRREMSARGAVA